MVVTIAGRDDVGVAVGAQRANHRPEVDAAVAQPADAEGGAQRDGRRVRRIRDRPGQVDDAKPDCRSPLPTGEMNPPAGTLVPILVGNTAQFTPRSADLLVLTSTMMAST